MFSSKIKKQEAIWKMDNFDAIKTRRAIKKFDNTYKMSPELLNWSFSYN